MKHRPYWSFLRLEFRSLWPMAFFPLLAAGQMWIGALIPVRLGDWSMTGMMATMWLPMTVAWGYNVAFLSGTFGFSTVNKQVLGVPMEFALSRAVSRRTVFAAKATIAWLCPILVMTSLLIRSCLQRDSILYLPAQPAAAGQRAAEGFKRLFPTAALGHEGARMTLSLPDAGLGLVLMLCLAGLAAAAAFQAAMALVQGRGRLIPLVAMGGFVLMPALMIGSMPFNLPFSKPGLHLGGVAPQDPAAPFWLGHWAEISSWTLGHFGVLVPAVFVAVALSWWYSASRFARQELTA